MVNEQNTKHRLPQALRVNPRFEDMHTTPLGLGMSALGRPGYINLGHGTDLPDKSFTAMQQHATAMLDHAYRLGIRYFDTAASCGAAEQFLGEWLFKRKLHIQGITVASKWGHLYTADWQTEAASHEIEQHTLGNLNQSLIWSCLRLGRAMQIYQIHTATQASGVLENTEILHRLTEIRDDGRLIGLTVAGPQQAQLIDQAIEIKTDGEPLFRVIQATWNLLETSAAAALSRASDAGMAVIIKEALANGRLTDQNRQPASRAKLARLKAIAAQHNCTLDQLSLAAAINQPWADTVLSGAVTPNQLTSNQGALQVTWQDGMLQELASLAEPPATYWRATAALPWN